MKKNRESSMVRFQYQAEPSQSDGRFRDSRSQTDSSTPWAMRSQEGLHRDV
jgi:hypothetical protein